MRVVAVSGLKNVQIRVDDFRLLFRGGRQREVQRFMTHDVLVAAAVVVVVVVVLCSKAAKYEIKKLLTCRAKLFSCKFWVDVSRLSPCVINS